MSSFYRPSGKINDPTQDATGNDGTQYRSAIYPLTPEQNAAAHASRERHGNAAAGDHRPITTEIAHATPVYYAEDEHQQYS